MKNRALFFCITLFLGSSVATAQVNKYHPLVDSGNVWSNGFETSDCNGGEYYWGFDIYQALGDSIINNLTYRKIYEGSVVATGPDYNVDGLISISPMSYTGILLRDDTVNKQVFIRQYGVYDTDEVLYDFNLNVEDTFPEAGLSDNEGFTVTFIDSVQLDDGTYRKRWGVTAGKDTAYFIEGIGFTGGFDLTDLGAYFYAECSGSALNCFSQQDTNLYVIENPTVVQAVYDSSHYKPCQVPTATGIYNPNLVTAKLFPNPVAQGGSITVKGISEQYTFTLENILGEQVFSKGITSPAQPISLPNSIPGGVYLCRIKTQSNLIFVKKIVIL